MPAVIMPKMGDAMEEVTLLKWLKNEGDTVAEGDAIAEIETDKVTLELTAENAGTLARRIAQEGQSVPVGQPIAMIAGEGESPDGGGEPRAAGTSGPPQRDGSSPRRWPGASPRSTSSTWHRSRGADPAGGSSARPSRRCCARAA